MIDTQRLVSHIDCRHLIEHDLGQPKRRRKSYSAFRCPLHHERKGFSLVVYAGGWRCFGKCGQGGDAIAWLQVYHGLSFYEACERLAVGDLPHIEQPQRPAPPVMEPLSQPPDENWQAAARRIAATAMNILWSEQGRRAWDYLETQRGLSEDTIVKAGLGYIPGGYREWRTVEGLRVPCGITIPWIADGVIWGIKVRRAAGEQRYQQVAGGNIKGGLYLADDIQPGLPILITEGEFDALIAQQAGAGLISAAALGSAANADINPRWYPKLLTAPSILVCMDDDPAGQVAAEQIAELSQASRRIQVPQGKDMNEFYLLNGQDSMKEWITVQSNSRNVELP